MAKRVAVVYWSGTGNTAEMAQAVVDGAEGAGASVELFEVSDFSSDDLPNFDAVAFGCPAMGDEELEDMEFRPVWDDCVSELGDKPIALFGSYSWAEGAWMENWKEEADSANLNVLATTIAYDLPDDEALSACRSLGAKLCN